VPLAEGCSIHQRVAPTSTLITSCTLICAEQFDLAEVKDYCQSRHDSCSIGIRIPKSSCSFDLLSSGSDRSGWSSNMSKATHLPTPKTESVFYKSTHPAAVQTSEKIEDSPRIKLINWSANSLIAIVGLIRNGTRRIEMIKCQLHQPHDNVTLRA
jgi:hypothetical protein